MDGTSLVDIFHGYLTSEILKLHILLRLYSAKKSCLARKTHGLYKGIMFHHPRKMTGSPGSPPNQPLLGIAYGYYWVYHGLPWFTTTKLNIYSVHNSGLTIDIMLNIYLTMV
jgi:hypothetical protein